jgi:hypothetical protein
VVRPDQQVSGRVLHSVAMPATSGCHFRVLGHIKTGNAIVVWHAELTSDFAKSWRASVPSEGVVEGGLSK